MVWPKLSNRNPTTIAAGQNPVDLLTARRRVREYNEQMVMKLAVAVTGNRRIIVYTTKVPVERPRQNPAICSKILSVRQSHAIQIEGSPHG